jgi:hypothetical protein
MITTIKPDPKRLSRKEADACCEVDVIVVIIAKINNENNVLQLFRVFS